MPQPDQRCVYSVNIYRPVTDIGLDLEACYDRASVPPADRFSQLSISLLRKGGIRKLFERGGLVVTPALTETTADIVTQKLPASARQPLELPPDAVNILSSSRGVELRLSKGSPAHAEQQSSLDAINTCVNTLQTELGIPVTKPSTLGSIVLSVRVLRSHTTDRYPAMVQALECGIHEFCESGGTDFIKLGAVVVQPIAYEI